MNAFWSTAELAMHDHFFLNDKQLVFFSTTTFAHPNHYVSM